MITDLAHQEKLINQLTSNPLLNATAVEALIEKGTVTINGIVDSAQKKRKAELAIKSITGLKGINVQINVGTDIFKKTDAEVEREIWLALICHLKFSDHQINIKVQHGVITLLGEVEWEYQRNAIADTIENFTGYRHIINLLEVRQKTNISEIQQRIKKAFTKYNPDDVVQITAVVKGNKVVLNGKVHSFAEKEAAEHAALTAPGISVVANHILVADEKASP